MGHHFAAAAQLQRADALPRSTTGRLPRAALLELLES